MALVSILFSAAATAFAATSISYDTDIKPTKRKRSPTFYGYVPSVGRGKVFILMLLSNTFHVLNKYFSSALFLVVSPLWFLLYLASDMGLYFAVKILTRDFFTWIPVRGAASQYVTTSLYRITQKLVSDFTGIVHFRYSKVSCFYVPYRNSIPWA